MQRPAIERPGILGEQAEVVVQVRAVPRALPDRTDFNLPLLNHAYAGTGRNTLQIPVHTVEADLEVVRARHIGHRPR